MLRASRFRVMTSESMGSLKPRPALYFWCIAFLLPLLLMGCVPKSERAQSERLAPPIEDTPPPNPSPSPTNLPPPVITVPSQAAAPSPAVQPQTQPTPPVRHKKPSANTQMASNGSPGVSAIGQLSSGDPSDRRQQTEYSIAATERGLNTINRPLNDQEQKTAAHIREFLKGAKQALASGDVDGAHTLASKAKVLLGELSR